MDYQIFHAEDTGYLYRTDDARGDSFGISGVMCIADREGGMTLIEAYSEGIGVLFQVFCVFAVAVSAEGACIVLHIVKRAVEGIVPGFLYNAYCGSVAECGCYAVGLGCKLHFFLL